MNSTIRVCIGTEKRTEIARRVLECSITRHTDSKVEFYPLIGPRWEYDASDIKCGTGFSLRRWMIPAFFGYQGKAIYLDADMLVFGDVRELWDQTNIMGTPKGTSVWCTHQKEYFPGVYEDRVWPQTSAMLIDCAAAKDEWCFDIWKVIAWLKKHPDRQSYGKLMHAMLLNRPAAQVPTAWNHFERYDEGVTRNLHYTSEPDQPWYNPDHLHADLWQKELSIALNLGMVTPEMIGEAIKKFDPKAARKTGMHPDYEPYSRPTVRKGACRREPKTESEEERAARVRKPAKKGEKKHPFRLRKSNDFMSSTRRERALVWVTTGREGKRPLVESFSAHAVDGDLAVYTDGLASGAAGRVRFYASRARGALDALLAAKANAPADATLIWVDPGARFTHDVNTLGHVGGWFHGKASVFYIAGPEAAGVDLSAVGFDLKLGGGRFLEQAASLRASKGLSDDAALLTVLRPETPSTRKPAGDCAARNLFVDHGGRSGLFNSPLGAFLTMKPLRAGALT